jgi:hypothetical protein
MTASNRLLLTVALLLVPALAAAQDTATAQPDGSRWWVGGGGGYFPNLASCTGCESERPHRNGGAFLVQGGLRVGARLLVGAEAFSGEKTVDGADIRNTSLLGIVQYRPFASHGFFIKGGYGMAIVKDVVPTEGGNVAARTRGIGLTYGAGWVFGEGRGVSIAPVAATYVTTVGDVRTQSGTAENVVINGWFAGVVVMFR